MHKRCVIGDVSLIAGIYRKISILPISDIQQGGVLWGVGMLI